MQQTVPAVFEDGVLRPLKPLDLEDHQRVEVTVTSVPSPPRSPEEILAAWHCIYEGLSPEEVAEVERIALDRSHFSSGAGE